MTLMGLSRQLSYVGKISHHFKLYSTATKLVYTEYGDPLQVVRQETESVVDPPQDQVLIKMLAAPVNPADINTIQGKYPVRPALPAVGGNEGVGEVIKLGMGVTNLKEGDRVVPLVDGSGTWRTHTLMSKNTLLKVPKDMDLVSAATFLINPCTAYRMLRDFIDLKPGDTVIQNGANSACGQYVIQICNAWGLKSVNIVRDRPGIEDLRNFLREMGATYVLTEEELRKTEIFKSNKIDKPKLALNCVGGHSALEILRHLQKGGSMVTYGGMSRQPVAVPTSGLIFKDLRLHGFWMTEWSRQNADAAERFKMFDEIIAMMVKKDIQGPAFKMVSFEHYKEALMNTMTVKGMIGKKYILKFN